MAASLAPAFAGCSKITLPPQVTLSEVTPSGRPALPPDCKMPVLRSLPSAHFSEVAIIEGLGSVYADEDQVLPAVVRKACEAGVDAIVIMESRGQTSEEMTGYYVNAIAIVYLKDHETTPPAAR